MGRYPTFPHISTLNPNRPLFSALGAWEPSPQKTSSHSILHISPLQRMFSNLVLWRHGVYRLCGWKGNGEIPRLTFSDLFCIQRW
jgi:hypothetical protein